MTALPGVYTQRTPEAGDLDECGMFATIWAAKCADPNARIPSVREFRAAAGDPDDGVSDGWTLDEIARASAVIWPHLTQLRVEGKGDMTWDILSNHLAQGRPASLAVDSGDLPARLRFGFYGSHQIGIARRDATVFVANPLAAQGSAPLPATEGEVRKAAFGLIDSLQIVRALVFVPVRPKAFRVHLRPLLRWWRYYRINGTWTRQARYSPLGWEADCTEAQTLTVMGKRRRMVRVTSGGYSLMETWLDLDSSGVTYKEIA